MKIEKLTDLEKLRYATDEETVILCVDKLKNTGALRVILRRAMFALRPAGHLIIEGTADERQGIEPYRFGWPSVRALAISSLGACCRILEPSTPGRLVFQRTITILSSGWSAGVIFSGSDEEIPQLKLCLNSLLEQKELNSELGEIIVCGPSRDLTFLEQYKTVSYLKYDIDKPGAFPISAKKNYLMSYMKHSRMLVLHTRITLDDNCISNLPREFDIMALNIQSGISKRRVSDLGLIGIDPAWPDIMPTKFERTTRHYSSYLNIYRKHRTYVDGGAFAVTKPVFKSCKLNPLLKWGDCEDVEWSYRAQSLGFSVDMTPQATAVTLKTKTHVHASIPEVLARSLRAGRRVTRLIKNISKF